LRNEAILSCEKKKSIATPMIPPLPVLCEMASKQRKREKPNCKRLIDSELKESDTEK